MQLILEKSIFTEKLSIAARFTSNKVSSVNALQGVLCVIEESSLRLYATNLTTFYTTQISLSEPAERRQVLIEPKKILEFLAFLPEGPIEVSITQKQMRIAVGKTKGNFPIAPGDDFPFPPEITGEAVSLDQTLLQNELPLVLFATSSDDSRPVLTGVNFLPSENEMLLAATDGFRLSVLKERSFGDIPSSIIPADFLKEVLRYLKQEKTVAFSHSEQEQIVRFAAGSDAFYSRLIDGEFPQFERVIPSETVTTVTVDRAELQRNLKLISVFAREYSHVVVCEVTSEGITLRPKKEGNEENTAFLEATFSGEPITIAFNYRFILDLLSTIGGTEVSIELLRSDAPAVFKSPDHSSFLHVIMPVRVQE